MVDSPMPALESREQDQHVVVETAPVRPLNRPPGQPGSSAGSWARKIGLLVILAAAAGFAYYKVKGNNQEAADTANKAQQAANRAIPVTTAAVVAKTMPIYLTALGTVTAYNTVTVKTRVDGQLLSVNVREGQQVSQGQTLAMIDPAPYQAAEAQAVGQLAKDQAAADYAKVEAARYTSLYDQGIVSKDSQQVQQSSAGQSAGVLDADRAAIQAAKVNVAYTRIVSPINGVVGLRQVDAGNIVHAADSTGLLVVTQLQPIAVIFTLPEDQLPVVIQTMRGGRKLVAEAYDRSDATKLATGTLLTLDNEIDTTTGTVKAKAVFDNRDGALFPNQFVNIRLVLEERPNSLVMPASALQSGATGTFVYILKPGAPPKAAADDDGSSTPDSSGGKAAKKSAGAKAGTGAADDASGPPKKPFYVDVQNISVDVTEGSQIILKSGLKAGDQVVVDGQEKLKKYSKVDPKDAAAPAGGRGHGAGAAAGGQAQTGGGIDNADTSLGHREGRGGGNAASGKAVTGDESQPAGGHHHKSGAPQ
jgi:multidrug efflux system membrane fusion protein